MKAMTINKISDLNIEKFPLELYDFEIPVPGNYEVLIKVSACGVCHTEIDEIEGRTPPPHFPVVPGHQVVGNIVDIGSDVKKFKIGDRVGVGWIYSACGKCYYCKNGIENLCPEFKATGRDVNGGYAEFMTIPENTVTLIPENFSNEEAAPLLCAGAIGYRSVMLSGLIDGQNLGLSGFGASAHLVIKLIKEIYPNSKVFVFARSINERQFALQLGAFWAGDFSETPPELLDSIIDTTPVWKPVVESLQYLKPGGRLIINAIRKENVDKDYLLNINYPTHLWMEKEIKSVANVTSADIKEFLEIAAKIPIKPEFTTYRLEDANKAILELKSGKIRGAKVIVF